METLEDSQDVLGVFAGVNRSGIEPTRESVSLYAYSTRSGDGIAIPATVVSIPVDGLYTDISDVAQTSDVQRSMARAWTVASESDTPPAHQGAVLQLQPPSEWETVGGGSAALSLALGFAGTNSCTRINESVAATGGLTTDGTIVDVQYVREKAQTASDRGIQVFLVPPNQGIDVSGISVVEVGTFEQAADRALESSASC
ncbi:S16 family serine protease [Halorhabdus sp. CUG00001]|uniref:S16 family serine protease n=1 Tax=Halorhabdus sp. CUG00001 TaxID=2600297 RepID=UPI001E5FA746|nr:S16 family serine protease [Halorhabdus sp. CUG00001]